MRFHPALMMLIVWAGAWIVFLVLPFHMTYRTLSIDGFAIFVLFIGAFCLGSLLPAVRIAQRPVTPPEALSFSRADMLLKLLALVACLMMGFDVLRGTALDLGAAYADRSERAQALLQGGLSHSSIYFKIGFICYPAGYVYLVRGLLLERRPRWLPIIVFGVLPGLFASLAMGGRAPLFNTLAYGFLAYQARSYLYETGRTIAGAGLSRVHPAAKIAAVLFAAVAFYYFMNVFLVRANVAGGSRAMLQIAAARWGVTFSGPPADLMIGWLGPDLTYLVFVFSWYLIQGIVISNTLFAHFDHAPMLGVYGIDVLTAAIRRLNPDWVSHGFNYLLGLDVYGFLPSGFGTLYVDYLFGGLLVAGIWGWLTGVVYRNVRLGTDPRWFLLAPFVTLGIVFSLVNTPIGYSNGFVTHFWLILAFLLMRPPRRPLETETTAPA